MPVTIMRLEGELDGSNYESLIAQTQALYVAGMRDLLLDLENLTFVSSAGLVGLHRMALIMRGETLEDAEEGWGAFHAVSRDVQTASGPETHYKLLKPQISGSRSAALLLASATLCQFLRMRKRPLLRLVSRGIKTWYR